MKQKITVEILCYDPGPCPEPLLGDLATYIATKLPTTPKAQSLVYHAVRLGWHARNNHSRYVTNRDRSQQELSVIGQMVKMIDSHSRKTTGRGFGAGPTLGYYHFFKEA